MNIVPSPEVLATEFNVPTELLYWLTNILRCWWQVEAHNIDDFSETRDNYEA